MPPRLPPQLSAHFRGVDGVTPVVAGPVGHEGDQLPARSAGRHQAVESGTDVLDHGEVRALALSAEIVAFARAAAFEEFDTITGRPYVRCHAWARWSEAALLAE